MQRQGWYLVAYDVFDPKRLRRVQKRLSEHGLPVQQSVYFLSDTPAALEHLLDDLEEIIHRREDDIRAWPISDPGDLWYRGNFSMGKLLSDQGAGASGGTPGAPRASSPSNTASASDQGSVLRRLTRAIGWIR